MRVFADSFYFIALLDGADSHHDAVLKFSSERRFTMTTTRWVLAEVADALSSPALRRQVGEFMAGIEQQRSVKLVGANDELFTAGLALYRARSDKAWSLTDCISFVVMERESLREALTGDRHFEQAGFVALFA